MKQSKNKKINKKANILSKFIIVVVDYKQLT